MRLLSQAIIIHKQQALLGQRRLFWGWLNAVFNRWVDYERIKAVGPDRAASEWLLRCGARVRFLGFDRWHQDYNALPTGPLGRYKIQGVDATESCIMHRGFDHLGTCCYDEDGCGSSSSSRNAGSCPCDPCIYLEDGCMEKLGSLENLQASLRSLEVVSCGNISDKGLLALHKLGNLQRLVLGDLPAVTDREKTLERLQAALPRLDITVDL
ncbi:hypothetical protein CRUP_031067 [Coryphaenoides rupestris]|nr:hypothetical protein CRUP_031067 [Coryphaenoides rupestris]